MNDKEYKLAKEIDNLEYLLALAEHDRGNADLELSEAKKKRDEEVARLDNEISLLEKQLVKSREAERIRG